MNETEFLVYFSMFAESEGYNLRQLFLDGDYNTIENLAEKFKAFIILKHFILRVKDILFDEK